MNTSNPGNPKLIVKTASKMAAGLTLSNHLSQAMLTQPEVMESILTYQFSKEGKSVLSMLTGGMGNTRFIDNREYMWNLHCVNPNLVEVAAPNMQPDQERPGFAGAVIKLPFAEKRFQVTDVIVSDSGKQCRIQSYTTNGINYIAEVVMMNQSSWLNAADLVPGAKFSKDYSVVGEFSERGGSTDFDVPMTLKNQLTTLRKYYGVSRSAATDITTIEIPLGDGTSTKLWTRTAEYNAIKQWYEEIDKSFIYSEYSSGPVKYMTNRSEEQLPIYTGAGIREQLSPANIRNYTTMSYDLLDSFLLDLTYNSKKYGGHQHFTALTGKMGLREFTNSVMAKAKELGVINVDSTFIKGDGEELTLQGHFTTVKFMNNVSLTVAEFAPYDDVERHRTLHPQTLKPIESYRFTILYTGQAQGAANIRKVAKRDSEDMIWHVAGSIDPTGTTAKGINTSRNTGKDGYEVHFLAEVGIQVQDPTCCGELIMSARRAVTTASFAA